MREVSSTATWRRARRTHWELLAAILESGCELSPLLTSVPFVDSSIFRVDWLHCADLGISADFLGNLFLLFMTKFDGRSLKDRCQVLWSRMQDWYKETKCQEKLQNLVVTMIRQTKKSPKLRCSAAQCRALIPFAAKLCVELLDANVPVEAAAQVAMENLHQCYRALSSQSIFHADLLRECSIRFAAQYVALEAAADNLLVGESNQNSICSWRSVGKVANLLPSGHTGTKTLEGRSAGLVEGEADCCR